MNYRHAFHAGNFADIYKHLALYQLLESLNKKDKPYFVLDAFAGIGLYEISSNEAIRSGEVNSGALKFAQGNFKSENLNQFANLIKSYINRGLYPGSPEIASRCMRDNDLILLCEKHPDDFEQLKQTYQYINNIKIHHRDAYEAIKALIPTQKNRGLVFLDPAFEVKDEFEKLIESVQVLEKIFLNGMICIWYPVKSRSQEAQFLKSIKSSKFKEISLLRVYWPGAPTNLKETGILVFNSPYQFHENLQYPLQELEQIFPGVKANLSFL